MDLELSEEQELLRRTVRDFAETELRPHSREWDEKQAFPREVFTKLGELGLTGVCQPAEYGGAGLSTLEWAIVMEELARVDAGVALSLAAHHSLSSAHINLAGNDEQKRRFLAPLATGEKVGCWGLTEPGSGSDAGGMRTTAVRDGGQLVLNGSKNFITNGGTADIAVVMAVTDRSKGKKGISAIVVERGTPGFRAGKKENKLGIRASDTAELVLEECFVPDAHMLGAPGEGFRQALAVLDGGRISIAALGLGTAIGAYETALEYSKQREQFGQPIAEFQAIRFALAEMATRIAAAEALTFAAATEMDRTGKVTLKASEAKLMTGEAAVFCSERGVQIHGGYGFIKDYRAEKYYRDAKICTIGEGTSEVQRLVIARELLSA
jgi:hypothetical protein